MNTERTFTGRGWGFPVSFSKANASVDMTSDRLDIERSLEILLGTVKGERVMRPSFGCNLDAMIFETFNLTVRNILIDLVKTAILYHEPRIELSSVSIDDSAIVEGRVMIEIEYIVRSTNSRFNMVYPFYREEGSEIVQVQLV